MQIEIFPVGKDQLVYVILYFQIIVMLANQF